MIYKIFCIFVSPLNLEGVAGIVLQPSEKQTGYEDYMNWILLVVAGLCEVGFTYCLGRARSVEGLLWWLWMGGFLFFTIVSMGLLAKVTQTMPLGTAYPVWTGIGAVGTVVVGILFFHEPHHVLATVLHGNAHCFNRRTEGPDVTPQATSPLPTSP